MAVLKCPQLVHHSRQLSKGAGGILPIVNQERAGMNMKLLSIEAPFILRRYQVMPHFTVL